jgi:ABC-type branched-subunit amino acid transport system ATPase component
MTATPVLAVHDIDFSYGPVQILFGVSLEVRPGQALALLGTNGAGKSTLLRVICGLERPTRGRVELDGRDITGIAAERLSGSGLVLIPGGAAVFGDLTVAENLEMQALEVRKRPGWFRERRASVLEVFPRLAERLGMPAASLSGGEQQQLALARAILLDPAVLCIDELSLGLAPVVVQGLIEVVRGLQANGVTVVLVEQSLNIAASLCAEAVFMEKGSVRFTGATADLLASDDIARAVFLGAAGASSHGTAPTRPTRRRTGVRR